MKNLKSSILESLKVNNKRSRKINENVNKNSIVGRMEKDINKAFYNDSIDPDDAMDQINEAVYKLQQALEKMRQKAENNAVIKKVYKLSGTDESDIPYYKGITGMLIDVMIDNIETVDIDLEEPFDNALQWFFYEDDEFKESSEMEALCELANEDELLWKDATPGTYNDYFMEAWEHLNDLCKAATGKLLR